jgi:hypothetical protein
MSQPFVIPNYSHDADEATETIMKFIKKELDKMSKQMNHVLLEEEILAKLAAAEEAKSMSSMEEALQYAYDYAPDNVESASPRVYQEMERCKELLRVWTLDKAVLEPLRVAMQKVKKEDSNVDPLYPILEDAEQMYPSE